MQLFYYSDLQPFSVCWVSSSRCGTGVRPGRVWEMPNLHPHMPPPLPPGATHPRGLFARCLFYFYFFAHLQLFGGLRRYRALRGLGARLDLLKLRRNAREMSEKEKRAKVWGGGGVGGGQGEGWGKEEEGGQSRSKPCHLFQVLSKIRLANLVLFRLQNATGRLFTLR